MGGCVGTDGHCWLGLLLFLVLFAEAAFGRRVDGPRHVVHTPMVSVLSDFLGMFLSILGRRAACWAARRARTQPLSCWMSSWRSAMVG
jgi:hypothetical protein